MKQYAIELNRDVITYIERLNYEYETLRDNVSYMVQHFNYDEEFMHSSLFRNYQQNQIQAKANLNRGMQEIYEKYVSEKYKQHRIEWNIDFRRKILIINQLCDCEV